MENFCFNITDRIKAVLMVLLALSIVGCKDVIEEDISNENVVVIIPQNNITLTSNNVHFKWEELEGASHYNLQLVEPSFDAIQTFILDSNITGTNFYQILDPGDYEFKVRAENGAYETAYTGPYSFTVDSVSDLAGQLVPLASPVDMHYTNLTDFTAAWQSLFAADYYEFQIRSGQDFNTGSVIFTESNIYGLTYATTTGPLSIEGYYSWGVKGINQSSQSDYNSHVIGADFTVPNDVIITTPVDAYSATTDTVTFHWNYGIDPGTVNSPISYSMHLGNDINFTTYTEYTSTVDSVTVNDIPTGTYYWRVYALDEAGNQSVYYSNSHSLIIP